MTRASDLARLLGAGATINDGTTITTDDNTSQLILQSTDADATRGPTLTMQRDSSSPADNDVAGQIFFNADNDAAEDTTYADVFVRLTDVSNGTEDASISFRQISNGSLKEVVMQNGNVDFGDGSGIRLGDGQDFQLYHDGTDNHINVTGSQTLNIQTSGVNTIVVDANGHVTKPLQSAFNVQMSTNSAQSGSGITPSFGTEHFDQNGDFSGTTFTAPVTGKYYLSTIVYGYYLDNGASYYYLALTTSNRQYVKYLYTSAFDENMVYYGWGIDVLADMDANDTATVFLGQVNGHSITQLLASNTYFTGGLFC